MEEAMMASVRHPRQQFPKRQAVPYGEANSQRRQDIRQDHRQRSKFRALLRALMAGAVLIALSVIGLGLWIAFDLIFQDGRVFGC
jgi:hypothetical protein